MRKSNKCSYFRAGEEIKKKAYLRPEEAMKIAKRLTGAPNSIHVFHAYKCTVCYHFHVGKSHKLKEPNGLYDGAKTS